MPEITPGMLHDKKIQMLQKKHGSEHQIFC